MMKSKRFEPIHAIVSTTAKDLSRAMGEASRKVAELEHKLQQLQDYRDEYTRHSSQSSAIMDAVKLQNYRSFIDRLGDALRQHAKSLEHARGDYEKKRAQWSAKRVEAESLARVVARFRQEEQHSMEQYEQREGDDAAMRVMLAAGSPLK